MNAVNVALTLCIGTVGIDEVETPYSHVVGLLGGSASYFAAAAGAVGAPTQLVSVVGDDFPEEFAAMLDATGADLSGLARLAGNCFRWGGRYHEDWHQRDTTYTELNVLAQFDAVLPDHFRDARYVFLANTDPKLQAKALDQVRAPELVVIDSMNLWIDIARHALRDVIARSDVVLMNDGEIRQYTGHANTIRGAESILQMGPQAVIVKRGEHGATLVHRDGLFICPAIPVAQVVDPTGAGDSFAGGFVGHLARTQDHALANFRRAVAHGCVVASYTVEDFSVRRLGTVTRAEVDARYRALRALTQFDDLDPIHVADVRVSHQRP
jgi:sugar/nucleoside kinase (ribokinase family)